MIVKLVVHFKIPTAPDRPARFADYWKLAEIPELPSGHSNVELVAGRMVFVDPSSQIYWSEFDEHWTVYCEEPKEIHHLEQFQEFVHAIQGDSRWLSVAQA